MVAAQGTVAVEECPLSPLDDCGYAARCELGVGVAYDYICERFIPGWSSQSRYPEVKHWLPTTGNSAGRFAISSRIVFNHRRSNMTKFPSTLNEEDLLTCEVSDEVLETAGGNEIIGNYTLAACPGLSVCPG